MQQRRQGRAAGGQGELVGQRSKGDVGLGGQALQLQVGNWRAGRGGRPVRKGAQGLAYGRWSSAEAIALPGRCVLALAPAATAGEQAIACLWACIQ